MRIWGKDPTGRIKYYNSVEEKFWDKVDVRGPDDCWPWLAKTRSGYGRVFYPDRYTEESAHRIAWMLTYGPIPKGGWILHHCDNRICVNPKHLHLGSHSDNMRECVERDGHNTPYEKLSIEDRRRIRELYNSGGVFQYELAKQFGVAQATISRCVNGRADNVWKEYV